MTALLGDEIVDRILDATDIVEVVASRIPLKKAGRNYKANCPFHQEKTPSFIVSHDKQIFHCFGCGQGGNVIGFLMKFERLTFRETMKLLSEKTGIKLPQGYSGDDSEKNELYEAFFGINDRARKFYHQHLLTANGGVAYRYLKSRGITDDSIKFFSLGYSPNAWDGLSSFFVREKETLALVEKAGLILARENKNGYYDRFRNRAMFPIADMRDRVIGFGARALDNAEPKYINSPETPIYNKGRNLYGLNQTKGFIKEKGYAVIVEGYLDLIVPFQFGVKNIAATLGTALTGDQIKLLKRFTQTVVILFDPDAAGEDASLRGLDILIAHDMNVRIATLPKGNDPDSFVRQNGTEAFENVIRSSKDLFDYKMGLLTAKFNKNGVRGRAAIATLMLPTIARIPNEILKAGFVRKLSEVLSIDETALKAELAKVKTDYSYAVSLVETRIPPQHKVRSAELLLLAFMLDDFNAVSSVNTQLGFGEFRDGAVKKIIGIIQAHVKDGKEVVPSKLIASCNDDESKNVIAQAVGVLETVSDRDRVMHDCMQSIRRENLNEDLRILRTEIRQAEEAHDNERISVLMTKYNELLKVPRG
ncbi:MAG: DNA primase [Candidatus Omnitrophica bacterium]|nr:DNA primase [Candidatus Omnitrophota bacterium]